jgi:hypothetical protein
VTFFLKKCSFARILLLPTERSRLIAFAKGNQQSNHSTFRFTALVACRHFLAPWRPRSTQVPAHIIVFEDAVLQQQAKTTRLLCFGSIVYVDAPVASNWPPKPPPPGTWFGYMASRNSSTHDLN